MTNLSPKAQAVLKAVQATLPDYMMTDRTAGYFTAVALRAIVAETQSRQYNDCYICGSRELLDVANELAQGHSPDAH